MVKDSRGQAVENHFNHKTSNKYKLKLEHINNENNIKYKSEDSRYICLTEQVFPPAVP